jgi:hypothetical protein
MTPRRFVLEHSREREPLLAGSPEAWAAGFELAGVRRIREAFRAASAAGSRELVLVGSLLNPTAEHGEVLARAFARSGLSPAIRLARWLPHGPFTPAAASLLRRVRTLEIDVPSVSPAASSMFHPATRIEEVEATVRWLRGSGVEPVLCVWNGLPGDDEGTLLATLRRACSLRPTRIRLRSLLAPPGSWLHGARERFGLVIAPRPPFGVLGHEGLDPFSARRALEVARRSVNGFNLWAERARRARRTGRS